MNIQFAVETNESFVTHYDAYSGNTIEECIDNIPQWSRWDTEEVENAILEQGFKLHSTVEEVYEWLHNESYKDYLDKMDISLEQDNHLLFLTIIPD